MKSQALGLLVFCLVISDIRAGWFSRSSSKGSSKGSGSRKNTPSKDHSTSHQSSTFLDHERGSSGGHKVQEHPKQSSYTPTHSDPYARPPASNPSYPQHHPSAPSAPNHQPYIPNGNHHGSAFPPPPPGISHPSPGSHGLPASPPYPHTPNHPLPSNHGAFGSSGSHPPASNYPPLPSNYPSQQSHYPIQQSHYPSQQSGHYPQSLPPFPGGAGHAPAPYQPHYSQPQHSQPHYQQSPASAPFIPGQPQQVHVIHTSDGGSRRGGSGIGSAIATGVAGGVAAGATNAIVDHAISSIFRSSPSHTHTYPSAPPVGTPTTSVTHITNNYYDGAAKDSNPQPGASQPPSVAGSSAPVQSAAPAPSQGNPSGDPNNRGYPSSASNGVATRVSEPQPENPPANSVPIISDETLMKFTEELFDKQDRDLNQYIELNLQKRVAGSNPSETVPDEAPEPLFKLKPELDSVPTVKTLRALYDNYQRDGSRKEDLTPERRNEENAFLEEIVRTPVMSRALNWLVQEKFVESDEYEQKDLLKRMWFSNFDGTSSGFERIFLSEKFGDNGIVGMQNWIYFAHLESQHNVNYLGYVDMMNLSGKGALLKMNYQTEGITNRNATIFTGTPPELEMALYTVCFYARPNNWCPVSLGGAKFFILTHSFRSFGKDLIDLGFPAFS